MNKYVIILTVILVAGLSTNLFAQKDRKLTNGFSINLNVGIPSSQYGTSSDNDMVKSINWGVSGGFSLEIAGILVQPNNMELA